MGQLAFTEFFCGIGGLSACLPDAGSAAAVDINQYALEVYRLNFPHQTVCKTIESLAVDEVATWPSELWWMSPPCQPYTRRGQGRDLDDPRAAGFLRVVDLIVELQPTRIGMENVPGFLGSAGHRKLLATLAAKNYHTREIILCPTQLGSINRRKRFYLIASREPLPDWQPVEDGTSRSRASHNSPILQRGAGGVLHGRETKVRLQDDVDFAAWQIPAAWLDNYAAAIDIVDEGELLAGHETTACFTSAYGRSPVRSGSYLRTAAGIRFFTPAEILWQLGFAESFQLPGWPPSRLWPLTGNTLALPAVSYVLEHLAPTRDSAR